MRNCVQNQLRFVVLSMVGFVFLIGCAPTEPQSSGNSKNNTSFTDWESFLGPNHDSTSPEKGILTTWPQKGLKILWKADLGIGYPAVAISKERLFHFDRFRNKARLTCRNARTGEVLWTYEYDTDYEDIIGYDPGPRAAPMVDEDRVYIHGVEGKLVCLNVKDGSLVWKVDTLADYHFHQNFFGVGSVPIIEGDLLIVPVGGSEKGERPSDFRNVKGNGTGIVAFEKKTGKKVYAFSDALASYSSPLITTINKKRIGLYLARAGLIGFDPKKGTLEFEFPWRARALESANASNPVVVGNQIFITECYELGSALLKLQDGKLQEIWTDRDKDRDEKSLMCHWNTPIHIDGYIYGSSGRHESQAELRCIKLATGEVMWREKGLSRLSLLGVDGHLLALTERGTLLLLKVNPKKYEEVARWKIPNLTPPSWAAPVLSHGLLYLRGSRQLICAELIPGS